MLAALTQSLQAIDLLLVAVGSLVLFGVATMALRRGRAALHEIPPLDTQLKAADGLAILIGYVTVQFAVVGTLTLYWSRAELLTVGSPAWYALEVVDIASKIALAIIVAIILQRLRRDQRTATDLPPGRGLRAALVAFMILLPLVILQLKAIVLLWDWLGTSTPPPQHPVLLALRDGQASTAGILLLLLGAIVAAPLGEELVFRGAVLDGLRRQTGQAWYGIVVSAVLFGLVHLGQPQTVPPLITMGLVLGYLRVRTGRLWPCILTHALFNARTMTYAILAPELIDTG